MPQKPLVAICFTCFAVAATAQEEPMPILFTNVNVFDGVSETLIEDANVLVTGNLISEVSSEPLAVANGRIIDGGGRTLMPGIIEAHGHLGQAVLPTQVTGSEDWQYMASLSTFAAKYYLDRGWTTVRDAGGPTFGLKKAIDEGHIPGPRIYPSGRFISQTSGHADFRYGYAAPHPNEAETEPFYNQFIGAIADGVPEVLRATREELRKGSVHIKVMAGGGISSQYDPLHTLQYSAEEMQAIVGAAADWGTYVMVHAYTDATVRRAIEAGVKVIEHGQLMTDETAKLAADNGVWLSTQIAFLGEPPTPEQIEAFGEVTAAKFNSVREGVETSINFAREYGINIAFGTDLWGPRLPEIGNEFEYRTRYFSDLETLQQATSVNGELLQLTGPLNPYPEGPIGVIQSGAYADIILVDGNPLDDVTILGDMENIHFVMKDGRVHRNDL
ncbi:metal-dependent hydrolase family protein [Ruegeria arenilitoris]|uniref:metal-dependent hydrolase family protein n=1 Tax=Ruegeria arenilitoris TaxID=1173585 RepID=UPI001481697E